MLLINKDNDDDKNNRGIWPRSGQDKNYIFIHFHKFIKNFYKFFINPL